MRNLPIFPNFFSLSRVIGHGICQFFRFFLPMTLRIGQGHPLLNLNQIFMSCISGANMVILATFFQELSHGHGICQFSRFFSSRDLENRSRSPIIELDRDIHEMHLWCEYGDSSYIFSRVIARTRILPDRRTDGRTQGISMSPSGAFGGDGGQKVGSHY